jgi:hypothetical protein
MFIYLQSLQIRPDFPSIHAFSLSVKAINYLVSVLPDLSITCHIFKIKSAVDILLPKLCYTVATNYIIFH